MQPITSYTFTWAQVQEIVRAHVYTSLNGVPEGEIEAFYGVDGGVTIEIRPKAEKK